MKKIEKVVEKHAVKGVITFMAAALIFVLGLVIGNSSATVQPQQYCVHTTDGGLALCPTNNDAEVISENKLIAMHNAGIAVFDLATIKQLERKGRIKKEHYIKQDETKTSDVTDKLVQASFVQVVDSSLFRQQLMISMNSDTVFVSPEYITNSRLDWIIEKKNNNSSLSNKLVFVDEFGTPYPSKEAWFEINSKLQFSNINSLVNQSEHLFYYDTAGVGVYGKIENGDTVILRIDSNRVANINSTIADTGSTTIVNSIPEAPDYTIDQLEVSDQSNISTSENVTVSEDVNVNESQPEVTYPKLEKKKKPKDNDIVKHDQHKLKKHKKQKDKKGDKSSIIVHF